MSDGSGQLKLNLPSSANNDNRDPAKEKTQGRGQNEQKKPAQKKSESAASQETSTTDNTKEVVPMSETTKPSDFESMLAELEKVVGQLEGELKLEQALSLFEKGLGLSQECEKFLKAAQQKIEILKRSANGEVTISTFAEESEALV
jgi:exodeoxyribonuclease VII small subunit